MLNVRIAAADRARIEARASAEGLPLQDYVHRTLMADVDEDALHFASYAQQVLDRDGEWLDEAEARLEARPTGDRPR